MIEKFSQEADESESLMNLTPLIDVVFVVLIAFMTIAPMLDAERIQLAPGSSQMVKNEMRSPLAITVRADNSIWVEGKMVGLPELSGWLASKKQRYPREHPALIYDARASFGTYQAIKNMIESSGFETLDIALRDP